MSHHIQHEGIIDSIDGRHIRVRVVQVSACATCKIAKRCTASDTEEKLIDVYANADGYEVGQTVTVSTSASVAQKALLLGFGIPLFILMGVLVSCLLTGCDEETSGLTALVSLVPYYVLLWLLRHRIAKSVAFNIEK